MNRPSLTHRMLGLWSRLVDFLSLEWLLTRSKRPNGGAIILLRTCGITFWIYILAVVLKQSLDPERTFDFSSHELFVELHATLPWIGPIFAGVYASLYTRFSS